ncbi:hypothetical protein F5B19DRAFT_493147 [Rostrohypoxylon terebratum]|nr:hypothetical protein F5B19DRAFT_493147 [Rostrohypoxylon terebratum]
MDTHGSSTGPSVRAGKAVFIEWPLVKDYEKAIALTEKKRLDNTIIGLQGHVPPIVLELKEILKSRRIGRVLSSDVRAYGNLGTRGKVSEGLSYFADREVGGKHITIAYGHTIDYVHELAKWKVGIADGATLSFAFRNGQQFNGTPGFVWTIHSESGEIMVTANGAYVHSDSYKDPIEIKLHDHSTDEIIDVGWDWEDWQKELPYRSRIVAELYERFGRWWSERKARSDLPDDQEWPRLHDAVIRMEEFDELFKQYDA